jgi:hypothetical protein
MVTVDLLHGGRWTSLRVGGREWLWHRPGPARDAVRAGDPFVDAGGLEECLPTVRGVPDHGAVWSRPWRPPGVVEADGFVLSRTIREDDGTVIADYRLTGEPGRRFVWAAHALLDLSIGARLDVPPGTGMAMVDGECATPTEFGPDDGTAVGAIFIDCPSVTVVDGSDRLTFTLTAPGQPVSTALWRNLGGFPTSGPYRSIGVEPMLGRVFDLATAGPSDAAVVPETGVCEWRLEIS